MCWSEKAKFALLSAAESFRQIADEKLKSGDNAEAMVLDAQANLMARIAQDAPACHHGAEP